VAHPGFSFTALTLLVLSIGAATAILSIACPVLIRRASRARDTCTASCSRCAGMALGATPAQVLRLFLGHGLVVTVIGLVCGVIATIAAARSLASLVFGVSTTEPVTLVAVAALLTGAALAAC
jgi:hypothetical protein